MKAGNAVMDWTGSGSVGQAKALYRVAGTTAVLIVLTGLVDALSSMGIEARDNAGVPVAEWFSLFQTQWFSAFSSLGVFNIITLSLGIPIYLAIRQALRTERPVLSGLAAVVFFIGAAVYFSSNTVFALFGLSQQYSAAAGAQKAVLEAAGTALLAQGADLTSGTFTGLFFTQLAGILVTTGMLRGKVFGKWTGGAGLVGFSLMGIFFVLMAFAPEYSAAAMTISMPAGLILMAYQILLARRFFQLARG